MDSERFDGLVRTFGHARSRRQALRGLAGLAAGALAMGGRAVRAQECKANEKACKKNDQCCSGNCAGGPGSGSTSQSEGRCQCQLPAMRCSNTSQCCEGLFCLNDFCRPPL